MRVKKKASSLDAIFMYVIEFVIVLPVLPFIIQTFETKVGNL